MSAIIYQFPSTATDIKDVVKSLWPESLRNQMANRDAFYGLTINQELERVYPYTSHGKDYD